MPFEGRGTIIGRAMRLIKALESRPHTANEIAEKLNISRSNASYYIREISVIFPVIETNMGTRKYHEPILYFLPQSV